MRKQENDTQERKSDDGNAWFPAKFTRATKN
jgi:hypothetical protein